MTTLVRRISAMSAGALVLFSGAVIVALDTAHATDPYVAVTWSAADASTSFLLNAQATSDVRRSGHGFDECGAGINAAIGQGIPMPDEDRSICEYAVIMCVRDASTRGNALSGVRFYTGLDSVHPVGTYRCLVR